MILPRFLIGHPVYFNGAPATFLKSCSVCKKIFIEPVPLPDSAIRPFPSFYGIVKSALLFLSKVGPLIFKPFQNFVTVPLEFLFFFSHGLAPIFP